MTLNEWCKYIHETAKRKGWYDKERNPLEIHALFHSEIAEATEQVRKSQPAIWYDNNGKPQGEAVELVDCIIRIMDWFEKNGWDLQEILELKTKYNETRPYRHGGKKY